MASNEDISYSIGYTIGTDMKQRGGDFDTDQIVEGLRAGLGQGESRLTTEQIPQCLFSFQMQMQQQMLETAQESLAKSEAFLAENALKEGVTVTESEIALGRVAQLSVLFEPGRAEPGVEFVEALAGFLFDVRKLRLQRLVHIGHFVPPTTGPAARGSRSIVPSVEPVCDEVDNTGA